MGSLSQFGFVCAMGLFRANIQQGSPAFTAADAPLPSARHRTNSIPPRDRAVSRTQRLSNRPTLRQPIFRAPVEALPRDGQLDALSPTPAVVEWTRRIVTDGKTNCHRQSSPGVGGLVFERRRERGEPAPGG